MTDAQILHTLSTAAALEAGHPLTPVGHVDGKPRAMWSSNDLRRRTAAGFVYAGDHCEWSPEEADEAGADDTDVDVDVDDLTGGVDGREVTVSMPCAALEDETSMMAIVRPDDESDGFWVMLYDRETRVSSDYSYATWHDALTAGAALLGWYGDDARVAVDLAWTLFAYGREYVNDGNPVAYVGVPE